MPVTTSPTIEHEIGSTGVLAIRGRGGSIRLRAVAGGRVRIHADDDLDAIASIERGDGSLAINLGRDQIDGGRRRGHAPDLVVDLPTHATVVVDTASGDIVVDGLLGEQRYRTASGDIRLREIAGRLSFETVSGDVDATIVDDVSISARTVSGDLALRAATIESLDVATTSGDVRLAGRLAGPGPFTIQTVSGDTLLAHAGPLRIDWRTVAGDVRTDIEVHAEGGRGKRVVTIGSGGPTLGIKSMSGDLRLVEPSPVPRPIDEVDAAMTTIPDVTTTPRTDPTDPTDAARLQVLQALERGEIDVDEAGRRLEAIDTPAANALDPADPDAAEEPTDG